MTSNDSRSGRFVVSRSPNFLFGPFLTIVEGTLKRTGNGKIDSIVEIYRWRWSEIQVEVSGRKI